VQGRAGQGTRGVVPGAMGHCMPLHQYGPVYCFFPIGFLCDIGCFYTKSHFSPPLMARTEGEFDFFGYSHLGG